jgi:hypothetical protein
MTLIPFVRLGKDFPSAITRVEKQNHTLRMHGRRLTRLTNAFTKTFKNFQATVDLNLCYYHFVKTHGAIRTAPAQAAGV